MVAENYAYPDGWMGVFVGNDLGRPEAELFDSGACPNPARAQESQSAPYSLPTPLGARACEHPPVGGVSEQHLGDDNSGAAMKVPNYKHPTRQDFPGISPEVEKALEAMGRQIREHTNALQGRLSLTENSNNKMKDLPEVRDGQDYIVELPTINGIPLGAIAIYSSIFEVPRVSHFEILGGGRVKVRFSFDAPTLSPVSVRVLFLGP